jgi:hypothetical protein
LDASDARHRDRLPTELRAGLVGAGYVNYLEAQAVVRVLRQLLMHAGVRGRGPEPGPSRGRPQIGVITLYPAQAELVRRLMAQDPALCDPDLDIRVDVPVAFRQQEYSLIVLSLTRSHGHRAVSFGEGPQGLELAFTRARHRLVICGDPGALNRRQQWDGPVDHLDEAASARERAMISILVSYLQGQGVDPHLFRLCEGVGA